MDRTHLGFGSMRNRGNQTFVSKVLGFQEGRDKQEGWEWGGEVSTASAGNYFRLN